MNVIVSISLIRLPTPWARRLNLLAANLLHSSLFLVSGISHKLAIFEELTCVPIQDRHCLLDFVLILAMRLARRQACLLGLARLLPWSSSTAMALQLGSLLGLYCDLVLADRGPDLDITYSWLGYWLWATWAWVS